MDYCRPDPLPNPPASRMAPLDAQLANALAMARHAGPPEFKPAPTPPSALDHQEGGHHYTDMKIQPVEYIHANGLPFIEGCVVKYVSRWRAKGGIKDLEKARHFIDLLIELEIKSRTPDEHVTL